MLQKYIIEVLATELAFKGAEWIASEFATTMHRLVNVKLTNRSSGQSNSYVYDLKNLRDVIPDIEDILGFDFSQITRMSPELSHLITSTAISAVRLGKRSPERFFSLLSLSKAGPRDIDLNEIETDTLRAYLDQPVANTGDTYVFPGLQTYHTLPFGFDKPLEQMNDTVKNNPHVKKANKIVESISSLEDKNMFFRNILLQEENFNSLTTTKETHVHVCSTTTQDLWLEILDREDDPILVVNKDFYTASAFLHTLDIFIDELSERRLSVYEISEQLSKLGLHGHGTRGSVTRSVVVLRIIQRYQQQLISLLQDDDVDSIIEFRSKFAELAFKTSFFVLNCSDKTTKEYLNSDQVLDIVSRDADAVNTLTQIPDDVSNMVNDLKARSIDYINSIIDDGTDKKNNGARSFNKSGVTNTSLGKADEPFFSFL